MNFDEEEIIEETQDSYDTGQDLQDAQLDNYDGYTYSTPRQNSDLWTWFWKTTGLVDPYKSAKVANLTKDEVGWHGISVRDAMNLSKLGNIFHHKKFGDYWSDRALINSVSSMGRTGWFMELSISQRKIRGRERRALTPEKWRLFGKKKPETPED